MNERSPQDNRRPTVLEDPRDIPEQCPQASSMPALVTRLRGTAGGEACSQERHVAGRRPASSGVAMVMSVLITGRRASGSSSSPDSRRYVSRASLGRSRTYTHCPARVVGDRVKAANAGERVCVAERRRLGSNHGGRADLGPQSSQTPARGPLKSRGRKLFISPVHRRADALGGPMRGISASTHCWHSISEDRHPVCALCLRVGARKAKT